MTLTRRLNRFRCTAPPNFRPAMIPTRGVGEVRTATKPITASGPRDTRRPPANTRRMSAPRVMRVIAPRRPIPWSVVFGPSPAVA
jgi:hypothetical protein